jgi:hypothetical protein
MWQSKASRSICVAAASLLVSVPGVFAAHAFAAPANGALSGISTQDDTDQTYKIISQCADAVAGIVTGSGVKGAAAGAIEAAASALSAIAQNAPNDPEGAKQQATSSLYDHLASWTGKDIKIPKGTLRIDLGQLENGAKCVTFITTVLPSNGRDTGTSGANPDCIPPANGTYWQPPKECYSRYGLPGDETQQPPDHNTEQPPDHNTEQPPDHNTEQPPDHNTEQPPDHNTEQQPGNHENQQPNENPNQNLA